MKRRKKRKNPFGFGPPSYRESHGGKRAPHGERKREVPDPRDNDKLIALGVLTQVEYLTDKGEGKFIYFHPLERPRPLLCYGDQDGRLYIVGGGYVVKPEGIVG